MQQWPNISSFGVGNAHVAWVDMREDSIATPNLTHFYCQMIRGNAPATPIVTYPENGSLGANRNTDLEGSAFSDPDPNQHIYASEWQIDNDPDFSSPEWTGYGIFEEASKVNTDMNGKFANDLEGQTRLQPDSTYYVRVRYENEGLVFSDYSEPSIFTTESNVWYLAEGCTDGGFETWVLLENPYDASVTANLTFQTDTGPLKGPSVIIPAASRVSVNVGQYVTSYNVSTMVTTEYGSIICERAMYGNNRTWGHDSIGITHPNDTWYMAEGCTAGGFETWVLVQNPGNAPVDIDMNFQTDSGPEQGPQERIPANSRKSYYLGNYVHTFNVSTQVTSTGGDIICERAMYGNDRTWGTDSVGVTAPGSAWAMTEGCTAGGFETWVLVQNPWDESVVIDMYAMTDAGVIKVLKDHSIAPRSRESFNMGNYVESYNVSTMVLAKYGYGGADSVICERAMYGNDRTWGHDSVGSSAASNIWSLAEGCTMGGIETWLLILNTTDKDAVMDIYFLTENGLVQGPQDYKIPPFTRVSFDVGYYVVSYNVSTMVVAKEGAITCEKSMYGNDRTWGTNSIGYMPDNPEFSATGMSVRMFAGAATDKTRSQSNLMEPNITQ